MGKAKLFPFSEPVIVVFVLLFFYVSILVFGFIESTLIYKQ